MDKAKLRSKDLEGLLGGQRLGSAATWALPSDDLAPWALPTVALGFNSPLDLGTPENEPEDIAEKGLSTYLSEAQQREFEAQLLAAADISRTPTSAHGSFSPSPFGFSQASRNIGSPDSNLGGRHSMASSHSYNTSYYQGPGGSRLGTSQGPRQIPQLKLMHPGITFSFSNIGTNGQGQQQGRGHQGKNQGWGAASAKDEDDEEDGKRQTELAKMQAMIKRRVTRDIKKVLMSSKAYVQHTKGPVPVDPEHTQALALPRLEPLHPELRAEREQGIHSDPIAYAEWKASQLASVRLRREAAKERDEMEAAERMKGLEVYQEAKAASEAAKAARKAAAEAEQADYGRAVARFVTDRAARDLETHARKMAAQRERAAALHAQITARGFQ